MQPEEDKKQGTWQQEEELEEYNANKSSQKGHTKIILVGGGDIQPCERGQSQGGV